MVDYFETGTRKIALSADMDLVFLSINTNRLNTSDWHVSYNDDGKYKVFRRSCGPTRDKMFFLNGDEIKDPYMKEVVLCCDELVNDIAGEINGKPFAEFLHAASILGPNDYRSYCDGGLFLIWRDYDLDVTIAECRIKTFDFLQPEWKPKL